MLVREIMNTSVVSVDPDESAAQAARLLSRCNIGSVPVCTPDGKLRGIVTDRDIVLRCVASESDPTVTPVRDIMTRNVISATPTENSDVVARLMSQGQIRRIPVVDGGRLVGIVSLGDLATRQSCCDGAAKALSDISNNVTRK